MFVLGAVVRVYYLDESRVNGEHQYQLALIARQHFLEADRSIPDWRKSVVATANSRHRALELPVFPFVTSLGYRMLGRETLTLPRLMATFAWLAGGVFLFILIRRLASTDAAWMATAYFLFVPSSVQLSVSFLPDAPMVTLMVVSLLAIVLFFERPSSARLAAASVLSTAAILVKPVCIFPIAGGISGWALHGGRSSGWQRRLGSGAALLVMSVSIGSIYYLVRIFRGDELAAQADVSFIPELLFHQSYWEGWLKSASWAVGFVPLILAILGLAAMRGGPRRAFAVGLWGGYVAYCLVFTYHIRFAGYYHLMLVPIVALSFAPLVPGFLRFIHETSGSWFGKALWASVILLVLVTVLRDTRNTFDAAGQFEPPRTAAEIGEIVRHSTKTAYLASYYGTPLEYYGELAGKYWPRSQSDWAPRAGEGARSVRERFSTLGFQPEYFIITDFRALRAHESELEAFLSQHCTLLAESPEYIIYDLRDCLQHL